MAHNNYYLDLCVDTFVVNDGAVLLRLHDKYNYWNAPGGHIDAGEDINEAALRELLPENWAAAHKQLQKNVADQQQVAA